MKLFAAFWAFVIIAPLVYFPGPADLFGHPWKVELTVSFLLFSTLLFSQFRLKAADGYLQTAPKSVVWLFVLLFAFTVWSGISIFWADSNLSVAHHTLVWICYLVFFLVVSQIVVHPKFFQTTLISLSVVVGIIAVNCILEYTFSPDIGDTFASRYARFAEIHAALLPLFFGYVLRLKKRHLIWAISVTLLVWLAVLLTMSRGALLSSVIGLSVFVAFRLINHKTVLEKKRLVFGVIGITAVIFLTQIQIFDTGQPKATTLNRLVVKNEKDADNSLGGNVRFLFHGVAREMFAENPVTGVGADNFGLKFNEYRAPFSADERNKASAAQQEWLLPERAHSEYLQILAELGIVGAALFGLFIFGIARLSFGEIKQRVFARSDILTHSAIAGMIAFLINSAVSSYSFRLMQNGLIFFFLLAIALRKHFSKPNQISAAHTVINRRLKIAFALFAAVGCLSLTVFSALKATSQFYVYQGERQTDFADAESNFRFAAQIDPANASANSAFGFRLLSEGFYPESAAQINVALEKGLNTSIAYSYLIAAQTLANEPEAALKTAAEAVNIYPYSVFLRVRYAALLQKSNRLNESAAQYEAAERLDRKQAETWRLFINEGAPTASERARRDKNFVELMELKPDGAIYSILTEREILYPQEKSQFNLGN